MYFLYTLLYLLALFYFLPKEFFKRPKHLRKKWLREKFGLMDKLKFEKEAPILWIHAVSVGEVLAITPLIEKLGSNYNILLTTITDTGREIAEKKLNHSFIKIFYLPLDLGFCLRTFINRTKPKALFLTETELWPNLILTASSQIPVALLNGRLSERSFKRYKLVKFFLKPLLSKFSFLAVQEEIYAKYFSQLGAPKEKIIIVGNLKFDLTLKEIDFPELTPLPRPIILAGSTHFPEEELILQAFLKIVSSGTLILVPRHPERFDKVEKLILSLIKEKASYLRYSRIKDTFPEIKSKRMILLFDEMGKLSSLYRICDLALVGGSFIPHGGQNPLEAIYWKKPVLTGPHMDNFPFVEEFVKKKGLLQVNPENLELILKELLTYPEKAKEIAERGYELFHKWKGALEKTATLIKNLVKE